MLTAEPRNILAEAAAHNLTQSYGISSPEQMILEDIALCRGVLVIEGKLKGADARLVHKGDRGLIRVKSGLAGTSRGRFAIAHELGHWELHKEISQWQFCTESNLRDYSSSPAEVEANVFAAELLMPSLLFRPQCEGVEPSLELIEALSEEYGVSITATAVRFVDETDTACIIVISENGRVKWWKKSEQCEWLQISSNWKIRDTSLAWDCFRNEMVPPEGAGVKPSAWFEESHASNLGEIAEQSIRLGKHPTVLTLLKL